MCGRFTLHSRLNLILQQFAVSAGPTLAPRYNIAPTQSTPVVVDEPGTHQRKLLPLRWGLVPFWADTPSIGSRMINARADTVATKPAFRAAFKRRRCLVPADGYYEWQQRPEGKQPFYLHTSDGGPFAMAGLWESWHSGQADQVDTFTIITTDANDTMAAIHDRMPVILDEDAYALWLDPEFDEPQALQQLLRPCDADFLVATPVSTYVNNPRHEGPQCIVANEPGG